MPVAYSARQRLLHVRGLADDAAVRRVRHLDHDGQATDALRRPGERSRAAEVAIGRILSIRVVQYSHIQMFNV